MLSIYLGKMDEAIYYPPAWFDNRYEDEWITEKLSVEMIKDVDKSTVVSCRLIDSPVLGPISVKELFLWRLMSRIKSLMPLHAEITAQSGF